VFHAETLSAEVILMQDDVPAVIN